MSINEPTAATPIEKNRTLLPAQDYALLRAEGLTHIQALSGQLWTDHNSHDPGITILELLAYALTDLGYRTAFPIEDLLERPDGAPESPAVSGLFPAHEVLTTAPLTLLDYRKLLLKIEGIRNAWLDPMTDPAQAQNYHESETPIYADCHAGGLSFTPKNALNKENPRVRVRGLYRVLLDMDINDVLGPLNESGLVYLVRRGELKGVTIALHSHDPAFLDGTLDLGATFVKVTSVDQLAAQGKDFAAAATLDVKDAANAAMQVALTDLHIRIINDRPRPGANPVAVTVANLTPVLIDSLADGLLPLFWEKQRVRKEATAKVRCVLDANRNLCEDFLSVKTVAGESIAVCADIALQNDADLEEVQARVFHAIEQYFNPPVKFYTLAELLAQGLCSDEIFDGPYADPAFTCGGEPVFTRPGFIKSDELAQSELRRFIYTSDIINILMEFPEIISVSNVLLRRYDAEGVPVGPGEKWCLAVTPGRQPVLAIDLSKVLLFKSGIPFRVRSTEFRKTLEHLREMARREAYVSPNQTLPLPRGRFRSPDAFYSIQHDLPRTYGVGVDGLPPEASTGRLAEAKQLKGYLTFYDQLLADYLAQLANARRLFSLDKTLKQSYFTRYLGDVDTPIAGVRAAFEDEFYVNKALLKDDAQRTLLTEDEELYQGRRNRLLDHLLARFAEQFTDYVLMMFSLEGDPLKTGETLIEDKIDFLSDYPQVSRERGKGFNVAPENPADVWDTENVPGLQKRVSRLVGMDDFTRRSLNCAALFADLFTVGTVGASFRLLIVDSAATPLFSSKESFATPAAALNAAEKIFPHLRAESTYKVDASGGPGAVFFTLKAAGTTLTDRAVYDNEADAVRAMRAIIDRCDELLLSNLCEDEGMHIIEHILLRPMSSQDRLMDVCLDPTCELCGDEDPYSFRIAVVLPYWTKRFRSQVFRDFFERTLRAETPAHIHARICWIGNDQMAELDRAWRRWLTLRQNPATPAAGLRTALGQLIDILERLKTVFPAASLHDCVEDEKENPVRLGSTTLGIF